MFVCEYRPGYIVHQLLVVLGWVDHLQMFSYHLSGKRSLVLRHNLGNVADELCFCVSASHGVQGREIQQNPGRSISYVLVLKVY